MSSKGTRIYTISIADVLQNTYLDEFEETKPNVEELDRKLQKLQKFDALEAQNKIDSHFKVKEEPQEESTIRSIENDSILDSNEVNYLNSTIKNEDELIIDEKFSENTSQYKTKSSKRKTSENVLEVSPKRLKVHKIAQKPEPAIDIKFDEKFKIKHEEELQLTDSPQFSRMSSTENIDNDLQVYKFTCMFCSEKFGKSRQLELHYRTHRSLEKMKCRSCSKEVMANPQFILRNQTMREFKCIKCTENGKKFESATAAKVGESKRLTAKCDICEVQLSSNTKLYWHMKAHLESKLFKCPVCREDFPSRESMIDHCKLVHSRNNGVRCEICQKNFYNVDLGTHMKIHSDAQQLQNLEPPAENVAENRRRIVETISQKSLPTLKLCTVCGVRVPRKEMALHKSVHDQKINSILVTKITRGRGDKK